MNNETEGRAAELQKLRVLLLKPEQERLGDLEHRLATPDLLAADLKAALPPAVRLAKKDAALVGSLKPVFEDVMKKSVVQDPSKMIDILHPVIGPAVRKAVNEAFAQLSQAINMTMETSLSWRSLKWRWEAWRTGKPYSEIVLFHKLVYRVEQLFLIHKKTGLLLLHVTLDPRMRGDAHLVSSMFTAIKDFVQRSFHADTPMSKLEMGDLTIWLEDGPHAYLALVGRGQMPEGLRSTMVRTLEDVHQSHLEELKTFKGDVAAFAAAELTLRQCMRSRLVPPKKPTGFLVFAGTVLALLLLWQGHAKLDRHLRATQLKAGLSAEPGIWLGRITPEGDAFRVEGLRDPLARQPIVAARAEGYSGPLIDDTRPYYSIDGEILLLRTRRLLTPVPRGVSFSLKEPATIVIAGDAPAAWVRKAARLARPLGVAAVDTSDLLILGSRPQVAPPKVEPTPEPPSTPIKKPKTLTEILDEISLTNLHFPFDDGDLNPGQVEAIKVLAELVEDARKKVAAEGKTLTVEVQALVPQKTMRQKMIGFHQSQKIRDELERHGIAKTTVDIASVSVGPSTGDAGSGVVIFKVLIKQGGPQ